MQEIALRWKACICKNNIAFVFAKKYINWKEWIVKKREKWELIKEINKGVRFHTLRKSGGGGWSWCCGIYICGSLQSIQCIFFSWFLCLLETKVYHIYIKGKKKDIRYSWIIEWREESLCQVLDKKCGR